MPTTINLKQALATIAVTVAAFAAAGPAGLITYNGHAGLGAAAYQHHQTDLEF